MWTRALALAAGLALGAAGGAGTAAAQEHEEHGVHEEEHAGAAGAAHGEEAHGEGHGAHVTWSEYVTSPRFVASSVNFVLLVALLWLFARKRVPAFLRGRREEIESGLAEAARLREAAESRKREYEDRLANLQEEIEKLRADMVKAGEAERDRIVAEAEVKASRMRRETEFLIEQQMKQLRIDLTREAVDAAIATAEGVLKQSTTAEDQQRLAKDYLARLGTDPSGAKRGSAP